MSGLPASPAKLPRRLEVIEDEATGVFLVRIDDEEVPYFSGQHAFALAGMLIDPRLITPNGERLRC